MSFDPIAPAGTSPVVDHIAHLKQLFPEAFTEDKIDFDVLRQLLGGHIDEREEKYGLNWHGKRRARQLALTPSEGTLLPCPEDSVDWDTTQNLMIEGDNLEVLKLLQKTYAGKVKLIYIDPPYNTGKDFVYPDNFTDSIQNYLELTGQVEGGRKISSNTDASGRFHTDWLNMMYPRLKLAKSLLKENGLIFVSVDDNELDNTLKLLEELFGEENWLGTLPTIMNLKGNQDTYGFAGTHEYTVVFAKSKSSSLLFDFPLDEEELDEWFEDNRGHYKKGATLKRTGVDAPRSERPNGWFPIFVKPDKSVYVSEDDRARNNEDLAIWPISNGIEVSWRWSKNKVRDEAFDIIVSGENGELSLYKKQRPTLGDLPSKKPKSIFYKPAYSSGNGTAEMEEIFGQKVFNPAPKPLQFLKDILVIASDMDDVVLDFFAGSGSIFQSVMELNALDGKRRKFIGVQIPQLLDNNDSKNAIAISFLDSLGKPRTIAEITKERLRRAGAKIKSENPLFTGDVGFRVFKLASSNIRAWNPAPEALETTLLEQVEHLLPGRNEEDVLFELLLKVGHDLCAPVAQREINGHKVYAVDSGKLIACFSSPVTLDHVAPLAQGMIAWHKELQGPDDAMIVFRDSAFVDDVVKTNMAETLKQAGLKNLRSL